MLMLVTHDVSTLEAAGRRRVRRVFRARFGFGQGVEQSVFECDVEPA